MFQQLLQRLHFDQLLNVELVHHFDRPHLAINGENTCTTTSTGQSLCIAYQCSGILVELQFDISSTPSEIGDKYTQKVTKKESSYAHTSDDLWRIYRKRCHVKSLLRLHSVHQELHEQPG